jgi:3-hydroxyisobutyrate dehydrogenase
MKPKIAFVGVGRMGANMARRLHDLAYPVTAVFDIHRPTAEALAAEIRAAAPATLAEVTASADLIFTVVTDDAAMRVLFAPEGDSLLSGCRDKIFVNCATLSPRVHTEIEHAVHASGAATLEACMASSIPQAREGRLTLICGGDRSVFECVEPVLKDLSSSLRHVGETGRAAQVKALVNMVMNINTAALAEGLGLAHALGLDLDLVRTVFAETGAASRVLQTDGEDMQKREHACFFSAAHAAKDSGIALNLARQAGLHLPLAEATLAQYRRMVELGLGGLDKSGIAELTFPGRSA